VIVKTSFSYVVQRTSGESLCLGYVTEDGTPRLPGAITQFTDVTEMRLVPCAVRNVSMKRMTSYGEIDYRIRLLL
jgi:hypothetical protein